MTNSITKSSIASALNYVDANYQEGCQFMRSFESNNGELVVDWDATDKALLSAMLTPFHDGWQGMILYNGERVVFNGSHWH